MECSELFEEESFFACSGVEYAFRRWTRLSPASAPASSRPVVLLHGFAQSSASWGEVASLLLAADAFSAVYALDFVGHGRSERPGDVCAYGMDAACEAVRRFTDLVARREGSAPVLVGYSMGGRIALECLVRGALRARGGYGAREEGPDARSAPDARSPFPPDTAAVSALVIESAGLGPADAGARLALEERNLAWARLLREEGLSAFMDRWRDLPLFESQRALSWERQEAQHLARLANDAEALARTFEGTGAHRQAGEEASLAALDVAALVGLPVLYLAGSLDAKYRAVANLVSRSVAPSALGASVCAAAPGETPACGASAREKGAWRGACGLEALVVEGAGHNIHLEAPEEFARILGCFAAGTRPSR